MLNCDIAEQNNARKLTFIGEDYQPPHLQLRVRPAAWVISSSFQATTA